MKPAIQRFWLVVALPLGLLAPGSASSQDHVRDAVPAPFALPWADVPPHVEAEVVRVAALGQPDERIGRFEARRDSARTLGRARALHALHDWVDDALASARVSPREAQAVHAAVEREARVEGVRPLVDAAAVVVLVVPREALRGACARGGLPWT